MEAFWIISVFLPSFLDPRVPTQRAGFSTIDTIRLSRSPLHNSLSERALGNRVCAYLGEHGNLQRLQQFNLSDHTISSLPPALPSRIWPDTEPVEHDGIPPFQDFHIADSGIRDVSVYPRRPVPPRTCPRASSNRFVISPTGDGFSVLAFSSNPKREVTGKCSRECSPGFTLLPEHTWCTLDWRHRRGTP